MVKRAFLFSLAFILILVIGTFVVFNSMALRDFAKRLIITQSHYKFGMKVDVQDVRISYFGPAIRIKGINLVKEDKDNKIHLSSEEAVVYFNIIKLIQGKIGISGFKLKSPKGEIEVFDDPSDNKKIDAKTLWDKVTGSNIDIVKIDNGNFKIKIKNTNADKYFGFENLNLSIKRGILSNYIITLSSEKTELPYKQIHSFDFRADVRNNSLRLSRADVGFSGGVIYFGGAVKDFIDYANASINIAWRASVDISKIADYKDLLPQDIVTDFKSGNVVGGGRISGKLSQGVKGLLSDVSLTVTDLVWDDMLVPKIELRGSHKANSANISKLDISDGNKSITIHDTNILFEPPYSIKGVGSVNDVELSKYLELFDIKKCVSYFNVAGQFDFSGSLYPAFKIDGLFDLKVKDFWVLKDKGLIPSVQNSILDFKEGSVYGNVKFSNEGAYFDNVQAKSQNNLMSVNGWITKDSTVDLDVSSSAFSVGTYGRVADLVVDGRGVLQTKLIVDDKGDFRTKGSIDFKEVKILDEYILGGVSSKVVYDKDVLSFLDVKGKIGDSKYTGYMDVLFGKNNEISLKGRGDFKELYSDDIYDFLQEKEKLFGDPSGVISGYAKFDGKPSWKDMKIESKVSVSDIGFASERFDQMYLDFLWNKGDILINDLYLLRGKGRFNMAGSRKNGVFNMSINSNKIDVADIGLLSNRVELDGDVVVKGNIKHANDKLSGLIDFNFSNLIMDNNKLKPVDVNLYFGDNKFLRFNVFDGAAIGDISEHSGAYLLEAKLKDFDVYPVNIFSKSNFEWFRTFFNGDVSILFDKKSGVKKAKVSLDSPRLNSGFVNVKSSGKVSVEYAGGSYSTNAFSLTMDYEGGQCKLGFVPSGKNLNIKGCVPASTLRLFKDYFAGARGKADVDLVHDGQLNGTMFLRDVAVTPYGRRVGSINVLGRIPVEKNILKLNNLNLSSGGATASFSGSINVNNMVNLSSVYPGADFRVSIDKFYLEYPDGLRGRWVGNVLVKGSGVPYSLTGEMIFYEASYRKDFDFAKLAFSRSGQLEDSLMVKKKEPITIFGIKLKSAADVYIKNTMMTGDVSFDVFLKGNEIEPKIEGSVDLLRGSFIYLDNTFNLISGRVKFKDDDIEPMSYQLDSEAKIANYQVYLKIFSDKGEPKFSVNSTPPLTEEKVLTLLATGDVQSDFMDQGGFTVGTGGNIVSEGLGFTGSIKKNTGIGMRLKNSTTKDSTMPDIEFQKDLTNDLKVIYGKSLDDNTNKQEVNVQYEVNRNVQLKLLFEEENNEDVRKDQPSNAGVDIKFKFDF